MFYYTTEENSSFILDFLSFFFLNKENHISMSHHNYYRFDRTFYHDNAYDFFKGIINYKSCVFLNLLTE